MKRWIELYVDDDYGTRNPCGWSWPLDGRVRNPDTIRARAQELADLQARRGLNIVGYKVTSSDGGQWRALTELIRF